jgi:transposase
MAADGYIKAAHSQLTSAVTQLQSEISELQHQLSHEKGRLDTDIKEIDTKRAIHKAESVEPNQDESQRQYLHTRLDMLSSERDEKRARMAQMDAEINQQIQAKQQAMSAIQGQANQINGMLTMPGVR